ncbi:MAG: hypothetical protein AB7V50_02705 [Vampirovibrionia bacterium]
MNNFFSRLFSGTYKFILNCIVVSLGLLATYLVWNAGPDKIDYFDPTDEYCLAIIMLTIFIVYCINKPPKKIVNNYNLNKALKQYSIDLTETIIDITNELSKIELIEDISIPKPVLTKDTHPVFYCHEVIEKVMKLLPETESQERRDISGINRVINRYIHNLSNRLFTMKESTEGKDKGLLENVQNTNFQLQRLLQRESYADYALVKELNKFLISAHEATEYIIRNHIDAAITEDIINKYINTEFNDKNNL